MDDAPATAASAADDQAIATDKTALLPGETATFANYTSYSLGINGIMVDVADLAGEPTTETVGDFSAVGWIGSSGVMTDAFSGSLSTWSITEFLHQ